MSSAPLRPTGGHPDGTGASRRRAAPLGQWWITTSARDRKPYAFLAFPPATRIETIIALATSAICSDEKWQIAAAEAGWCTWRHGTSGRALTMIVAGYLPVIVVVAPGSPGAPARPGIRWLVHARAVGSARSRFIRAARGQGARVVSTSALPGLVAQSAGLCEHWDAINHRLTEMAEADRIRFCPRCGAGCRPSARWCTRCEYEFGQGDDHARDRAVLERRREADVLRRTQGNLAAQSFPPLLTPGVPVLAGGGGPR